MAFPVSSVIAQTSGTTTASLVFGSWFDSQLSGDYILIAATNDGGGTALSITGSHASDPALGWVEIGGPAPDNAGCRTGIWYRRNTGTAIASPTISGATDDWAVCAVLIRDADTSSFLDVAAGITEQVAATTAPTAPSVATSTDGCLILRILGRDGSTTSFPASFGEAIGVARCTDNFNTALNNCETLIEAAGQISAGATGSYVWDSGANDSGRQVTLAIRNRSGGGVYATPSCTGLATALRTHNTLTLTSLSTWHSTMFGQTVQPGSGTSQVSLPQVAGAPQTGAYGFGRTISVTQPATTGAAGVYGVAATLASAANLSGRLVAITFRYNTIGPATLDDTGPGLYFRDGAGGWAVLRPFNKVQGASFNTYIAVLSSEATADGSGTIDWSNITHIGTAQIVTSTVGVATGRGIDIRNILAIDTASGFIGVAGGSASRPCTSRDIAALMASSFGFRLASLQGNGQNLVTLPVRIGNGSSRTFFSAQGQSLEYPVPGSQLGYSAPANSQDVRVLASATDVIDLNAGIFATQRQQDLTIDPSSSTAATYREAATFIGWNVVWRNGVVCDGAAFIGCGKIDAKGAQFNRCTVSGTTATDAAIAFDANSSMSGTSIDATGTAASFHLELGTAVSAFTLSDCSFVGSAGTNKVRVLATSGTVTITLAGTTNLTFGEITSAGATVVLVTPSPPVSVTCLDSDTGAPIVGARVRLTSGLTVVLSGVTNASGQISTTWSGSLPASVTGWARSASASPYYIEGKISGTITSAGFSATVLMQAEG